MGKENLLKKIVKIWLKIISAYDKNVKKWNNFIKQKIYGKKTYKQKANRVINE